MILVLVWSNRAWLIRLIHRAANEGPAGESRKPLFYQVCSLKLSLNFFRSSMHQQGGERSWLMTEEMHRGPLLRVPFSPIQTISRRRTSPIF